MNKTREESKVCVYEHLTSIFEDYRSGWIYEDFFKCAAQGFKHFESSIDSDDAFKVLTEEFEDEQDFSDYCYDIASDIASNIKGNDFLHSASQMFN